MYFRLRESAQRIVNKINFTDRVIGLGYGAVHYGGFVNQDSPPS